MTMTNRKNMKRDCLILDTLENLTPVDHLVRKLEAAIDWKFIYPLVENLYSPVGRASIDPVILFKMLIINIVFGYNSMRMTCREIQCNVAYRWFLGIEYNEKVPDYSTFSQNYIRRFKDSEVFKKIFYTILAQAAEYGFVDVSTVFGDGTHQKASANKKKCQNAEVEIVAKEYDKELLAEINRDRGETGHKPFDSLHKEEYYFDEETGEERLAERTKNVKESITDPECGLYHKGEKEKMFAYEHQVFCDRNGFVLETLVVPGNVHDSVSFFEAYNHMTGIFGSSIKNVVVDAAYKTPAIAKAIYENGQTPMMPYKRPMTKKGFFKKSEFSYNEEDNTYTCPNNQTLRYTVTSRQGYRQYKSDGETCSECPFLNQCTNSKNHVKLIQRHVWERHVEKAEEQRHTEEWKNIYPQRKETIERTFADCKENMGLRYTRLRGVRKNQNQSWLIFACHNLKRMALWKSRNLAKLRMMWG